MRFILNASFMGGALMGKLKERKVGNISKWGKISSVSSLDAFFLKKRKKRNRLKNCRNCALHLFQIYIYIRVEILCKICL